MKICIILFIDTLSALNCSAKTPCVESTPNQLLQGEALRPGSFLCSPNKLFILRFLPGNKSIGLYDLGHDVGHDNWALTAPSGELDRLQFEINGNFILYAKDGTKVWEVATFSTDVTGPLSFQPRDTGNLVVAPTAPNFTGMDNSLWDAASGQPIRNGGNPYCWTYIYAISPSSEKRKATKTIRASSPQAAEVGHKTTEFPLYSYAIHNGVCRTDQDLLNGQIRTFN